MSHNTPPSSRSAFTLIELLVVIVIIGVLATLATVAVNGARTRARDSKRVSDLKQISTALEMYYADYTAYPNIITPGQPLVSEDGTKTYMAKVPNNPTPRAEGACSDLEYQYSAGNDNYSLIGCLSKAVGDVPAGARKIEKSGQARDLGPTNGLVGWWMLDGLNGTKDLTGNGYNGVLTGAVTSTGRFGEAKGAYLFDDAGDYIVVSDFPTGNYLTAMTASCWFKLNSNIGINTIMSQGQQANSYWWLYQSSGTLYSQYYPVYDSSGGNIAISFSDVTDWNFIVRTAENGVGKNYLNGGSPNSASYTGTFNMGNFNLVIGSYSGAYWSNAYVMNGLIADCRVYNRALSQVEITALYTATKPQ